jgi:hypothetical protein
MNIMEKLLRLWRRLRNLPSCFPVLHWDRRCSSLHETIVRDETKVQSFIEKVFSSISTREEAKRVQKVEVI